MPADVSIPMPNLEPMMRLVVDLSVTDVGLTPAGHRREVSFVGTATSPHWDGERSARGVDHIVASADGTSRLDVHTVIGTGDEVVAYRGTGRARTDVGSVLEGVVFETASERLAWMNSAVAVGVGRVRSGTLVVELFRIVT